jgi:hypothetical protein
LPIEYRDEILKQVKFMKDNHCGGRGFQNIEIQKLERLQYLIDEEKDIDNLKDFVAFFDEHDRRRNTNFLATFPELTELYNYCKNLGS